MIPDPARGGSSPNADESVREGVFIVTHMENSSVDEKWMEDEKDKSSNEDLNSKFPEYGNKPKGPEPTRFGDWQYKGRSTDF